MRCLPPQLRSNDSLHICGNWRCSRLTTVPGLLEDLRVLDLTDERSRLAGRAFADLGADVVAFEPHGSAEDVRWRVERAGTTVVSALDDGLWSGADVVLSHVRP